MFKSFFSIKSLAVVLMTGVALVASSCKKEKDEDKAPDIFVPADGVLINGVVWAKYNVDAVGTFAATPEAPGKFYQWNRKIAWDVTGVAIGWDYTVPDGESWEDENDPSPEGWRVPTRAELHSLLDTERVSNKWVTLPANGRLFTDNATKATLFLPAVGFRDSSGFLESVGSLGTYWSSRMWDTEKAYYMEFYSDYGYAYVTHYYLRYGHSIRSVLK